MELWLDNGSSVEDLTGSQLYCSVNGQSWSSLSVSSSDTIIFSSQQPEYSHSEPYVTPAIVSTLYDFGNKGRIRGDKGLSTLYDFDALGQDFSGERFDAVNQTMNLTFDDVPTKIFHGMTGHDPNTCVRNTSVSEVAPGLGLLQDSSSDNFEIPFTQRCFNHEAYKGPFTSTDAIFVSPIMDIVPPSPSFPTHTESGRPITSPCPFGWEEVLVQNANPSPEVQTFNSQPSRNGDHQIPLILNQPMVDVPDYVSLEQTVSPQPQRIHGDDFIQVLAQDVQNMHMERRQDLFFDYRTLQSDDGEINGGGRASNSNQRNTADREQKRQYRTFSTEETRILIDAVRMKGRRWAEIKRQYFAESNRTREDLKDKWRTMKKTAMTDPQRRRGEYLSPELLNEFCEVDQMWP